jgi:choline transport protein
MYLALASVYHPTWTPTAWQVYLCYVLAIIVATLQNTVLFKTLPYMLRMMVVYLTSAAFITLVVLLVRATPKRTAQEVFLTIVNATGWKSDGLVFLLGLLPAVTGINFFDAATHMTDEVPDPARQIPKVMIGTTLLAGFAGLPMVIVFMFCVVNEEALLAPIGGQPYVQLLLDSCRSMALTTLLTVFVLILYFVANATVMTTMSRVLWSLSESNHVIFSPFLAKVETKRQTPQNAILVSALLAILFGLLVLGPTTALNAMIGSAQICILTSYMVPIGLAVYNSAKLTAAPRSFNLGRFGIVIRAVSFLWMLLICVTLLIPLYLPVTGVTMNYSSAVLGGIALVYLLNWFLYARKRFVVI